MSEVKEVLFDEISTSEIGLRPPQIEKDEFKELLASIKTQGILIPLVVRASDEDPEKPYELVDGLQRYTCAEMLSLQRVPVHVVECQSDVDMMIKQMHANLQGVKTQPAAAGRAIKKMLVADPTLTVNAVGEMLSKSPSWVSMRINLNSLLTDIQELVDDGKITAQKAHWLAKLPPDEQPNYVKSAIDQEAPVFIENIQARIKDIRDAARAGKEAKAPEFVPSRRLRPVGTIKAEMDSHEARASLIDENMSALDGWDMALSWVMHMDPPTVEQERAKWEAEQEARAKKKEEDAAKRKARKEAEAEAKAEEVQKAREDLVSDLAE